MKYLARALKRDGISSLKRNIETHLDIIDIPTRWKKHIHSKYLASVNATSSLDELRYVHKQWNWIVSKSDIIWIVIDTIDYLGSASVKTLLDSIVVDFELYDITEKREKNLEKAIRRAMKKFFICGIVESMKLGEKELGHDQYSVTLWISPFVTPQQLQISKDLYIKAGGVRRKRKKSNKSKKSPKERAKELVDFGDICKEEKFLRKVRKENKKGIHYYKCPKCESTIKIEKKERKNYNIIGDKLVESCYNCGHDFREKIT